MIHLVLVGGLALVAGGGEVTLATCDARLPVTMWQGYIIELVICGGGNTH